jgi:hypothetical protein
VLPGTVGSILRKDFQSNAICARRSSLPDLGHCRTIKGIDPGFAKHCKTEGYLSATEPHRATEPLGSQIELMLYLANPGEAFEHLAPR